MLATIGLACLLALASGAGCNALQFIVDIPGALTISRMDPIATPGEISGHVHRIVGASNFNAGMNSPQEQLDANCTTVQVGADKSNYWVPSLYWINKNGTYTLLPHSTKIYYMVGNKQKVQAFPPGMRMITGLAGRRDPSAPQANGFDWNMSPYQSDPPYNHQYLPNGTAYGSTPPKGGYIHGNIRFPNCGLASQQLDSDDHFSHMSWQIRNGKTWDPNAHSGICPESHPIQYPSIFLENFYWISEEMKAAWDPVGPNFILSNGDTTGVTFHADFISGWDVDILQKAIETCDVGLDLGKCEAFLPTLRKQPDCRYQGQIPDEDVGHKEPLVNLPGCNPRWDWNMDKKPTDCPWYKKPGWVSPNLMFKGSSDHVANNFPVVLPGVNVNMSNLAGLGVPQAGRHGWIPTSKYVPWARSADLKRNVTNVMVGTQAEVNASVTPSADNANCKVFGRGVIGKGDLSREPVLGKVKDLAAAIAGSGGKFTETYRCREPLYLPCGPPANATNAQSASAGAAVANVTTPNSPVLSPPAAVPAVSGESNSVEPSTNATGASNAAEPSMNATGVSNSTEASNSTGVSNTTNLAGLSNLVQTPPEVKGVDGANLSSGGKRCPHKRHRRSHH